MRLFVKPLLILGLVLLAVVGISWFAFPGWRTQPGGSLLLAAAALTGTLAIFKDGLAILKTWKELQKPEKPKSTPAPRRAAQKQVARDAEDVEQDMTYSGANQTQTVESAKNVRQTMK